MDNKIKALLLIIIIIFIIGLDLFLYFKTNKLVNLMIDDLVKLEKVVEDKNIDDSKTKFKKLKEEWGKAENVLSFFIEHEEIEKVSTRIASIEEKVENEEYEDVLEKIAEAKFLLKHVEDKYNLDLKNFF